MDCQGGATLVTDMSRSPKHPHFLYLPTTSNGESDVLVYDSGKAEVLVTL